MTILQGLKLIEKYKLPHPEWEFVRTLKGLKKFYSVKDYVGWTIRTVAVEKGSWRNLYVNWLPKKQVPAKVDELQRKQKGKALFVVYPSWRWKKGGTILKEKGRTIIEAVKGEIVNLMRKGKINSSYVYNGNRLREFSGQKNFLGQTELRKIREAAGQIKMKGVILEWAITTQNKFTIYRLEKIREASKLLLKKYGGKKT
ncbi:MAG: hypothetical protein ABIH38_01110 [Patescibacteria group bacterium]